MGYVTATSIKHHYTKCEDVRGKLVRKCKYCSRAYEITTSNPSLVIHLQKNHAQQYFQYKSNCNGVNDASPSPSKTTSILDDEYNSLYSSTASSTSVSSRTPSILSESIKQYQTDQFHEAVAEYFAVHSIALRSIESPEFLKLLNAYKSSHNTPIPTRKKLGLIQRKLADERTEGILAKVARAELPASLALDGWSNCAQSKVTNVMLLSQGNAYYLKSYENKLESTTSDWLFNTLQPLMDFLDEKGVQITGIVMDNASVNNKLYELLKTIHPHLVRLPCAAHILQLCVKAILKVRGICNIVEFMDNILTIFRTNSSLMMRLKKIQQKDDDSVNADDASNNNNDIECVIIDDDQRMKKSSLKAPLTLVRPMDTRWSSSLYAAQRILKLKHSICYVAREQDSAVSELVCNEAMWKELSNFIDLLIPFQITTDIFQSDSANLYSVYKGFTSLLKIIEINSASSIFDLKIVKKIIINYWRKHINIHATIMSAIFSFDTSHQVLFNEDEDIIGSAKRWFIQFAVSYLFKYRKSSKGVDINILEGKITQQYGKFKGRLKPFDDLNDRIAKCIAIASSKIRTTNLLYDDEDVKRYDEELSSPRFDPKELWFFYSDEAPELAMCALALLSLPSSEASVERSFSQQAIVHRKHRNRLNGEQVEAEMKLKFNRNGNESKNENHSLVNVVDIIQIDEKEDSIPLFQIDDDEEDEDILILNAREENSDDHIVPHPKSNKRKLTKPLNAAPENESSLNAAHEQDTTPVAQKRRKVNARTEVIIPYEDYANVNSFISFYVEKHQITSIIRWNESSLANLHLELSEWTNPIKDTNEEMQKKINLYIRNQAKSSPISPPVAPVTPEISTASEELIIT
jgi:hypothetical protein